MFGTRDEFAYWECSACGCLQILEVPNNLGDYYPDNYYTYSMGTTALQRWMYRAYYKAPGVAKLVRPAGVTFQSVMDIKPKPGTRILDVGCGGGKMVSILRTLGFDAQGIDPFAKSETAYVHRARLEDMRSSEWDLLMFHHSLEHMSDHIAVLRLAREKLATGGRCLVRIPLVNWAWQHYGADWVQLDPPRHFILHTPQSFRLAAEAAGFRIVQTIFDSGPFQFYGSDFYQQNIPLVRDPEGTHLDKSTMQRFKVRSSELNKNHLGDQASFHLEKVGAD